MFVLLPLISYGLLVGVFARKQSRALLDAIGKSHLVIFAFVAIATELLSAFHALDFYHVVGLWILFAAGSAVALKKSGSSTISPGKIQLSPLAVVLLGVIALILAATFFTALIYPPNNWDSLTYHMARIPHWIDNRSVGFYPTGIERQNFDPPLAEFAIMHLQVLSGSDRFANLVQWTCFVVCIVLSILIAAEFSLDRAQRVMCAVVFATLPLVILQSTSTQNDLVVTSFLMSFALFMLRLEKDFSAANAFFAALSLGLALLTKGTAYIVGAAVGIVLAVPILLQARSDVSLLLKRAGILAAVCVAALAFSLGLYLRSSELYGIPVYTDDNRICNEDLSLSALAGNIPKNIALHLGTRSPRINQTITETLRLFLRGQMENRKNNYIGLPFRINPYSTHDDYAGNHIHVWLALVALPVVLLSARRRSPQTVLYAVALLVAGCLYCFCLKWQPWASRLQTPLFALSGPLIVLALASRSRNAALIGIVVLVLFSLPFLFRNAVRPLLSPVWLEKDREELYFINGPERYTGYRKAVDFLKQSHAQDVGLYIGGDDWEYPLWALARDNESMRFRHVRLSEQSKRLEPTSSLPDYVFATTKIDKWPAGNDYSIVFHSGDISLLKKVAGATTP